MPASPSALPTFGRYQLVRRLAQGGMAEIYYAKQQGPGGFEKGVAIKLVLPHHAANTDFVKMFLDEARISALLSHPNVVQVFDFGEAEGSYYLAMEYLCGEDLRTILREVKKSAVGLPPVVAANIISAAADGLHHAHLARDADGQPLHIVHRDISPANLLVTFQGVVKVLDFGIAKAEGKLQETRTGVVKGKLMYMSPEQIQAMPVDGRSDVFALGAVLYELLSGQRLFARDSDSATLHALIMEPAPPPSQRVPGSPPELDAIVLKALERDRDQRYASALELKSALDDYLSQYSYVSAQTQLRDYLRTLFGAEYIEKRLATPTPAVAAPPDRVTAPSSPQAISGAHSSGSLPPPVATNPPVPSADPSPSAEVALGHPAASPPAAPASRGPQVVMAVLGVALALTATALVAVVGRSRAPPEPAVATSPRPSPPEPTVVAVPPPAAVPPASAPVAPTPVAVVAAAPAPAAPAPVVPAPAAPTPAPSASPAPSVPHGGHHLAGRVEEHHSPRPGGMLTVNCVPWCKVLLDGTDTGKNSPLMNYAVPSGTHVLKVINPPTGKSQTLSVEIEPGVATLKTIQL